MNKKDMKKLAKSIAQLEHRLQTEDLSDVEQDEIEAQIEMLCMKVTTFQDMDELDEMIQDFLKNF